MSEVEFDPVVTAVRVFTTRPRPTYNQPPKLISPKRRYPYEALVFDTETTIDPSQRLLFGVWRLYRDPADGRAGETCTEEGIFYPDDLPATDPDGYQRLVAYATSHPADSELGFSHAGSVGGIELWPLSRWLEDRLYRYGRQHRNRCDIVGFNLLFDFARIASHWSEGRGRFYRGWSFGLWGSFPNSGKWKGTKYRPRLLARAIDPRRTLFEWGHVGTEDDPALRGVKGRFVDLRTLAFALTDASHTLESACKAFGDEFEKADVQYGVISEDLIRYAREDVEHTAVLYRRCLDELDKHQGIDLRPGSLYSPATVGTQYLKAMGVEPAMDKFRLPHRIHGWAMSAFYGGRAEARIVRTHVPVAYVDATSMYPTVNALLGTWPILTAERITEVDVTDRIRSQLADPDLYTRCFDREFWADEIGVTLVEVDHPDGHVFPIRGEYDEQALDPGIGVNPLRYDGTIWYALPDVIAATLLSPNAPPIRRAIRLQPDGTQPGLTPVLLRGSQVIDPGVEDPFRAMIELRHRTKRDETLDDEERGRLDKFLKITANATAYGILARFDRRQTSKPVTVTVHGPDGAFDTTTRSPEDPGPYCFPPVAATITAAARLMLAMLERAVTDAGGTYAFCDTDSMTIVCHPDPTPIDCPTPDGTSQLVPLHPDTVRQILDRFQPLNPYDPELIPRLWKEEHDSLDNPVWCYAISAKRYALYRKDADGTPTFLRARDSNEEEDAQEGEESEEGLVAVSEHGLGAYVNPYGPDSKPRDRWIREAWEWIITSGDRDTLPQWADTPALTRFSMSSPAISPWFEGYNRNRPRNQQVRPAGFGLIAQPEPFHPNGNDAEPPRLAAPYDPNPDQWLDLPWYDRNTGRQVEITTLQPGDPGYLAAIQRGAVRVRTLGDVLNEFRKRPEHKSLGPDGTRATSDTRGLLRRRPIESAPVLTDLTGKEGNQLEERAVGLATNPDGYRSTYGNRGDRWTELVVPVLRSIRPAGLMERTGRSKSTVYEVLSGKGGQYRGPTENYRDVAVAEASTLLESLGIPAPRHPYGILYRATRILDPGRTHLP